MFANKKQYTCTECGKVVEKISSSGLCLSCIEKAKEDKLYFMLRDFIRDNPNTSKAEISMKLRIPIGKISKLIDEYRIEERK